jgi:hypothetical protein
VPNANLLNSSISDQKRLENEIVDEREMSRDWH